MSITPGTGSHVATGSNLTPAYPATGMGAGKLAFLHTFTYNDAAATITPPGGWTQRGNTVSAGSGHIQKIYSKELDGTESPEGIITVAYSSSAGRASAMIYIADIAGSGWNFESIDDENGSGTTISDNDVTTTGTNRICLNFIGYSTQQTGGQENFTGETGGAWVASSYFEPGFRPTLSLQTCELASSGTIGSGTDTSVTSGGIWIIHGMAIYRNAAVLPNLRVTDILWDNQPAVGKPTRFSAEIFNAGAAATPAIAHNVRFAVAGTNVAFSTGYTTSIAVSATAVAIADGNWVPSVSTVSANVSAEVDHTLTISESNETDNQLRETITVINLPNLRISDILWTPGPTPVVGNNVQFSAVIENAGIGVSPVTAHVIKFSVGGTDVATATGQTASVAVSALVTASADGFWVPSAVGTFSVVATVDPTNIISEANDADNSRTESITIDVAVGNVTSFNGRGGAVVPIQADYDAFFLTPSEGDDLFTTLAEVTAACYDKVASDAKYLTQALADPLYITQAEADAQGMPAIEAGGTGTTLPVREVNANFTLLTASAPQYYWQSYYNIGAATIIVSPPSGYTIVGSSSISPDTSALFIKKAGASQFRRWS